MTGNISKEERIKGEFIPESIGGYEKIGKCPECGSKLYLDSERAELICEECGLVVEDSFIDPGPEWRAFDEKERENKSRVGSPMTYTLHDKGLSTMIDTKNKDSYGSKIPSNKKTKLYRLRKWQKRARVKDSTERNLLFALGELDRMSSQLNLPKNLRETAALIYRKAVDENLIQGRSIEGVSAASLYASCRKLDVPRTLEEIAEVSRISKKEIGRTFRFISRKLNLDLNIVSPRDFIPRFCSKLNLSEKVKEKAKKIIHKAEEKNILSGKGPTGIAASSIYIASIECGEKKTQKEIAEIASVTKVTIRNRYKELVKKLGINL
ncbi:MAG: Transcription initiation factor TFIIB family [Candidatus Methanohalarchaeum thermophilum]|uniref:Transcription initiation factor IIB n=1 Tax=Methanohalarchaeum thermophilum TaxID=1903181 RepID=A0A1Q6DXA1_METT1|nr:MAG: Transcription initiation factor TFIIB family [Candidatus Methanohalarchaeum thermophilum]